MNPSLDNTTKSQLARVETRLAGVENRLPITVNTVNDHETRIAALEGAPSGGTPPVDLDNVKDTAALLALADPTTYQMYYLYQDNILAVFNVEEGDWYGVTMTKL